MLAQHDPEYTLIRADVALIAGAGVTALILCILVSILKPAAHQGHATPGSWAGWQVARPVLRAGGTQPAAKAPRPWGPAARPYIVAHRGLSGTYPEHTRAAYLAAIASGADFIECDVVLTADLVPLCRHDVNLVGSTDALAKFPNKLTTREVDGENVTGIFAADLTYAEVKTLKAVQRWPFRDQQYNGKFPLVTFPQYLDIALSAPRTVGVYPETKNPTYHNSLPAVQAANTSIEAIVLRALAARGYAGPINSATWRKQPIFLQSFELSSLRTMAQETCAPMMLLLGGEMNEVMPDKRTVAELLSDASMLEMQGWVAGVAVGKTLLAKWRPGRSGELGAYESSGVLERVHEAGFQVHVWTLRAEAQFVMPHLNASGDSEMALLFEQLRVDGAFMDYATLGAQFLTRAVDQGFSWNMSVVNAPHAECVKPGPGPHQRAGTGRRST